MKRLCRYFKNVLIAIDQLINAICGGYCDESISAVCYRKSQEKGHYGHKFLKFWLDWILSPFEHDHCFQSYLSEMTRQQLPERYQKNAN